MLLNYEELCPVLNCLTEQWQTTRPDIPFEDYLHNLHVRALSWTRGYPNPHLNFAHDFIQQFDWAGYSLDDDSVCTIKLEGDIVKFLEALEY